MILHFNVTYGKFIFESIRFCQIFSIIYIRKNAEVAYIIGIANIAKR